MTRVRITRAQLVALFKSHKGICHICGGIIQAGEKWERSHPIPLALGGADDASNWAPAHFKCHRNLTAETDIPAIAKAKRREANHIVGPKQPKRKIASRGFAKRPDRPAKPSLPVRNLYE